MNKVKTQHEADDSLDCLFHFFNLGDQQLISINHFLIRCRRSDTIEKSANLERTGGRGWTVDEIPAFFELDLHDYAITERISTLTESTPYPVVSAYPPPPPCSPWAIPKNYILSNIHKIHSTFVCQQNNIYTARTSFYHYFTIRRCHILRGWTCRQMDGLIILYSAAYL